ncbi:MAG TPA: DUF885 family protein [Fimbriimonadaceae bacterium]|nr:DUF885 family protein [Fimbriimonadaceae bacterium]HRJ97633.1 DUF885 family protein [Fimbriimonadaceae bacterium]
MPQIDLRQLIETFVADRGALDRLYSIEASPSRRERLDRLFADWQGVLADISFESLDYDDQVDLILLEEHLARERRRLDIEAEWHREALRLLPFAEAIIGLEETRRRFEPSLPAQAADALDTISRVANSERERIEIGAIVAEPHVGHRAAQILESLRDALKRWHSFYDEFDPLFTWWCDTPYSAADQALDEYSKVLKRHVVGIDPEDRDAVIGSPIGREALLAELAFERIPYSPEELITIAEREFAWCDREMVRAAGELGYGDDSGSALKHVKDLHEDPGGQPELVRRLAVEAVEFLRAHDLVTVPPLCEETWRMEMMPPERQKVAPFFLGGETIMVSFPTTGMTHAEKRMSLRGNNRYFSRATVQHELIPGHHLQQFMLARHKPHRALFGTPFWIEGWALHWEMLLWDLGFPRSPEERIGMLFWRRHRCGRIVFSLRFHLGEMSADECVDYLVERVGHERANAAGEVRRSFGGDYPPLYQLAYMIGGLQMRALHRELVGSARMTNRDFHDAILEENQMPIEVLRHLLTRTPLTRPLPCTWRFAD